MKVSPDSYENGNLPGCFSVQILHDGKNSKAMTCSNVKCQKNSNRFEANKGEVNFHEDSLDPFDFLAIGTLGTELINTDPPTPTFPTPFENWKITENDLKIINYELEKFLEAEEKNVANASGRSSQASIITLSHKQFEEADTEGQIYTMTRALQNYLFATSIGHTHNEEVKKERVSVEGPFKENDIDRDIPKKISEGAEQESRKNNVVSFMKRVVKKFHSSSICSRGSCKNNVALSISIKKKLSKAMKTFHRKVHSEEKSQKQFAKLQKSVTIKTYHDYTHLIRGPNENKMIGQAGSKKSSNKLCSDRTHEDPSTNNGEHWIKTDSEYLVLEL